MLDIFKQYKWSWAVKFDSQKQPRFTTSRQIPFGVIGIFKWKQTYEQMLDETSEHVSMGLIPIDISHKLIENLIYTFATPQRA